MFRVLFLILVVMSSIAVAQMDEKPKAVKYSEFETATNGYVKMIMDGFYVELSNNPASQGYIINYGTDNEIAVREKQFRNAIFFRKFDAARITLVRGGFWKTSKSELWVVPSGAENPQPTSNAEKFDEFGKATIGDVKARLHNLYLELNKNPNSQGYIINYGSKNEIIARENQIRSNITFLKLDLSRVTIKKANANNGVKTEFWIIPADASLTSSDNNVLPQKIAKPIRYEKIGVHSEKFNLWIFGDYFGKLKSQKNVNGYILINADDAEYAEVEKKFSKYLSWSNVDPERVVFVKGKPQNPMTSELWFVPKEVKSPNFTRKAEKFDEFGKLSRAVWKRRMKVIAEKANAIKYDGSQLFIINYGTQKDITVAESLIEKYLFENCRDCFGYNNFKINFVRGKLTAKARRVFWIVPDGAEPPKP